MGDNSESVEPTVAYTDDDWTVQRTVEVFDEVGVGDTVIFEKEVRREDVEAFAEATGDTNRLHIDPSFAEQTLFDESIAHGVLVKGLTSAAIARLPGVAILTETNTEFVNPANINSRYVATCKIVEDLGGGRWRVETKVVDDDGEVVVIGEATILLVETPEEVAE